MDLQAMTKKSGDSPVFGSVLRVLAATLSIACVTALLVWARLDDSIVAILFLTTVVWVATRAGVRLSLYVALLCAISFDYFFLAPIHTLRLAGLLEWTELISFIASSVIVSRLGDHARKQAIQAEQRRTDVEQLYTLSQEMMLHEDAAQLMRDLPQMIERTFSLETVVLYVRDQDRSYGWTEDLPAELETRLRTFAEGRGTALSDADNFSCLSLMLGMKNLGTLAWRPAVLTGDTATAVGAQVAVALTRAAAIETYTRLEAARESERLRSALIDSVTHELRTPLTGIRAAATMLVGSRGLDDATRQELAELLDEESARLDRLIGEAIDMAEIDAKVMRVNTAPMFPRTLLEHAAEESRAALMNHKVIIEAEDSPNPVWLDQRLLGRVLRHLVENAARYSPSGSRIILRAYRRADRVEFSVEDDGPGIDAADMPHIFDKFYRGRKGIAMAKGSGMGLSIAKAIVEVHGGGIDVQPSPDHGAIFSFWVPLMEHK